MCSQNFITYIGFIFTAKEKTKVQEITETLLEEKRSGRKNIKRIMIVLIIILFIGIISIGMFYQFAVKKIEFDKNLKNGNVALEKEQWIEAKNFFDEVLKRDTENPEALFGKAKALTSLDNFTEAQSYYEAAIKREKTIGRLKDIYQKYIASEVANKISEENLFALFERAAKDTGDEYFLKEKSKYLVSTPSFNLNPGIYQNEQKLEIIKGNSLHEVYFTTDGSSPTKDSTVYKNPIELKNGIHIIKAIGINENNFPSKVLEGRYEIQEQINEKKQDTIPIAGKYYIQAGAFKEKNNADKIKNQILGYGYNVSLEWGSDKGLYTLVVEKNSTLEKAEVVASNLRSKGIECIVKE